MLSLKEWVNVFAFHLEDGVTSHTNAEIHGVRSLMKAACLPTSEGWITCLVAEESMRSNSIRNKAISPYDAHLDWTGTQLQ